MKISKMMIVVIVTIIAMWIIVVSTMIAEEETTPLQAENELITTADSVVIVLADTLNTDIIPEAIKGD